MNKHARRSGTHLSDSSTASSNAFRYYVSLRVACKKQYPRFCRDLVFQIRRLREDLQNVQHELFAIYHAMACIIDEPHQAASFDDFGRQLSQ